MKVSGREGKSMKEPKGKRGVVGGKGENQELLGCRNWELTTGKNYRSWKDQGEASKT